jgi:hypothetical protein
MRQRLTVLTAVLIVLAAAAVAGAAFLHATTDEDDGLYRIDTADGSYTFVGTYTLVHPEYEQFIGGLAYDEDIRRFYGVSVTGSAHLYTIDPDDAATTDLGPIGFEFVYEGGLALDPITGFLYGVNQGDMNDPNLFILDKSTGEGEVVGVIAEGPHDFAGLVFDENGQLYGLDRIGNALWEIDKFNPGGANTQRVGNNLGSGITVGNTGGMAMDASGVVYGYAAGSTHLFSINLATGAGTVIRRYTTVDPVFYALGFEQDDSPVEPMSWGRIKSMFAE